MKKKKILSATLMAFYIFIFIGSLGCVVGEGCGLEDPEDWHSCDCNYDYYCPDPPPCPTCPDCPTCPGQTECPTCPELPENQLVGSYVFKSITINDPEYGEMVLPFNEGDCEIGPEGSISINEENELTVMLRIFYSCPDGRLDFFDIDSFVGNYSFDDENIFVVLDDNGLVWYQYERIFLGATNEALELVVQNPDLDSQRRVLLSAYLEKQN